MVSYRIIWLGTHGEYTKIAWSANEVNEKVKTADTHRDDSFWSLFIHNHNIIILCNIRLYGYHFATKIEKKR